jgi:hypothetical protein
MKRNRVHIPIFLPIAIVVCLVLGLLAGPFIQSRATEEQLNTNVLLSAIPFILIFASIILAFITLIILVAQLLNGRVSRRLYRIIETAIIAGIVLGILGMFQSWIFDFYRYGFFLLLFSTLAFIIWSHVTPRSQQRQVEVTGAPLPEKRHTDLSPSTGSRSDCGRWAASGAIRLESPSGCPLHPSSSSTSWPRQAPTA